MACDNDELLRLSQEESLKLDPSLLPPQVPIPSSLEKQKSSLVKSIDYHADSSQVSRPFGPSKRKQRNSDPTTYHCDLCKVSCAGKISFKCHLAGKKHQRHPKRSQKSSVKCAISNVDQVSLLRIIIEDEHHLEISPNFPANFYELFNVHCEEFTPYSRHFSGMKRDTMKPEQNLSECLKEEGEISDSQSPEEEYNPKEIICAVCDVKCSSLETYNSHLQGKQHAKTVKLQRSRGCEIPDVRPQTSSNQSPMPSSSINPENCIEEFYSGKNKRYSCRLCSCICNNSQLKDAHLVGKKHRTALRKLKESLGTATAKDQSESNLKPEIPTEHTLHSQSEPSSNSSSSGRPQIPTIGFARPCITSSSGLQALISLPPHLLADERYMQTKLKHIVPSKEENDLMILAVDAVCGALQQIHKARSQINEDLLPSDEPSGVYLVGPAAIGLLLRGQRTADVVLVFRQLLPPNCINEMMKELEGMLKITCKNHRVTLINEEKTQLVAEISPNPSSPHPSTSTASETFETNSSSDHLVIRIRIRFASPSGCSDSNKAASTSQAEKEPNTNSPDQLTDVRQTVWLRKALFAHPDKIALLNVARLVRCLIRDSLPVPWGEFPDYVLLVLLGHLSLMDLPPPGACRSSLMRIRPGLLFRRFLESLASGVLIDPGGELSSISDHPGSNFPLLNRMKASDRIAATSAAQEALRLVAFRQIYKLLGVNRESEGHFGLKQISNRGPQRPLRRLSEWLGRYGVPGVLHKYFIRVSDVFFWDIWEFSNTAGYIPGHMALLLDLPKFVPPCLTHYPTKNGVESPSTALKTAAAQKSSELLGKRKMGDSNDPLIGSGCGEGGGFGGDIPLLDNQPTSEKVIKLDEEGYHDCEDDEDKKVVCGDSTV
ncbi:hypothetical protein ACTXT7_005479 [Hymenolepis weldensis]